jgi:peptidoglycan/xylan/chitin deacetylase (PgdA/CDA1 family)
LRRLAACLVVALVATFAFPNPLGATELAKPKSQVTGPLSLTHSLLSAQSTANHLVAAAQSAPLTVSASQHAFSPNADGRKDHTIIRVHSTKKAHIITSLLRDGDILRTWRSSSGIRDQRIVWKGKVHGSKVRDDHYKLKAVSSSADGAKEHAFTTVIIDTRSPRAVLHRVPRHPVSGLHSISFGYWAWDRSPRLKVRIEISDALGRVDTRLVHHPRGRAKVTIHPTTPQGRSLPPGPYTEGMIVTDDAGNSTTTGRKTWRIVRPVRAKVFTGIPGSGRRVALSFDDCRFPGAWRKILHELSEHHVKATFFCPGQEVWRFPVLARKTVTNGNDVGSHGWDHALLTGDPPSATAWRLRQDARAWWKVAHYTSVPYFRPPYGAYDSNVLRASGDNGYGRVILWNVDPTDWQDPAPSTIAERVLSHVHPGSIVVMHVKSHTADALPQILHGLTNRHLHPVNLDALFAAAGRRYFR